MAAIDLSFLFARVQGVLLVETTNDVGAFIHDAGIAVAPAAAILACLIMAIIAATAHPIATRSAFLVTATLVGLVLENSNAQFADVRSVYSMFIYESAAVAVLMILHWMPVELQYIPLTARAKFVLEYAAGERAATALSANREIATLSLFAYTLALIQARAWYPPLPAPTTPLFLRALVPVLQQASITLAISVFITQGGSGDALQDVVYCLNLVAVVVFLTALVGDETWASYALWRVADYIITDLAQISGSSLLVLTFASLALYALLKTVTAKPDNSMYVALLEIITATTATRTLLAAASAVPPIDLVVIRALVVIIFL